MAMDTARKRLEKELNILLQNPLEGLSVQPKDDNLFEWTGAIQAPQMSPYAGGSFRLRFRFPQDYPLKPPTITFATKIYHLNIDSTTGFIGLNILHDAWSPALIVSQILLSLSSFLANPDPENPVMPEIAHEYQSRRPTYEEAAKEWTEKYAKHTL